jgi:ankyrin repeat protein
MFNFDMFFGFIGGFPPVIFLAVFLGIIIGVVLVIVGVRRGSVNVVRSFDVMQSQSNKPPQSNRGIFLLAIIGVVILFFGFIGFMMLLETKPLSSNQKITETQLEVLRNGSLKEVKMLLKQGVNINIPSEDDIHPFYIAVGYNPNVDVVKYLISKGAKVNIKSPWGDTPLHAASHNPNVDVVKYLISKGADIHAKDSWGRTPLYSAVVQNNQSHFYDSGTGQTLLYPAVVRNTNIDVLKYLISQGADVNAKDKWGWTPFHRAVERNTNIDVLECLVSQGADVNAKIEMSYNETPLHLAAEKNPNIDVLKYLISQGADVNAKTELLDQTPLDLANSEEKKKVLRDAGGK